MKLKRPLSLSAKLWPMVLIGILSAFCLPARADLWVTGYYPGWEQSSMPASNIDFTVVTLVIHAVLTVNPDVTVANSADLVSRAHAAGRPVLISVGGAATSAGATLLSRRNPALIPVRRAGTSGRVRFQLN